MKPARIKHDRDAILVEARPCGLLPNNTRAHLIIVLWWSTSSPTGSLQVSHWALVDIDEAISSPAYGGEPGECMRDRCRTFDFRQLPGPSREPPRGRTRIKSSSARDMLSPIVQHVHEGVSHLPRRTHHPRVVAISPHRTVAPEDAVDRLCYTNGQAAHTTLESRRLVRLHQQVEVIMLDAEVQDPESSSASRSQRSADRLEWKIVSERRNVYGCAQGHVRWTVAVMRNATRVRHATPTRRRPSSGAFAPPTPRRHLKLQLSRRSHDLNWQISIIQRGEGQSRTE